MLANAIYEKLSKELPKDGVVGKKSSSQLIVQVEKERQEITEKLVALATPIETEQQLIDSARVSTESEELGNLIGSAQFAVGKDGYLLAEETIERTSSVEMIKGIRIDNGFGTSQVVNNQEKQTLEVEDTRIILTSYSIKTAMDWKKIIDIYDKVVKSGGQRLVVIARAWTDETINFALQNINQGASIYPLNAPYVDMQERFKDLAALTGATFYDSESYALEDMQVSDIGYASKVIARRFDAIIAGKEDDKTNARIAVRAEELNAKLGGTISEFERKGLIERLAQLNNGFGMIKVGSPSDMERRRLFDKAEDAVNAVRAAYQEGTVPGAGLAFKQIADTLPDDYLLKQPLYVLYNQIMATAPQGFVIEDWVRDSVKVLRIALLHACSVSSAFASAGAVITEEFQPRIEEVLGKTNPTQPQE
jgi:chaperonin GroEL